MENLESYGVSELRRDDTKELNGGVWPLVLALTAMGIHDSIEHPDAFLKGLLGEEL
ncbi:hypothetical protein Murru_3088 [Allomuricauda ruestringensis DSM 13258]|uniref:Uncharacterized protein n=1 Tax=Allomuricauda ruestringensis (strain DSM 13258 / CIP 107369 / LMG 19739 / B1) TaxID=886377 RepID=G2PKR3_ALLRU|nr:hypothetical protein [Allomuricauda ruestringensis]AEM72109.1 hypothetical protein Murru_3088 [Allomuricauda ruestringensis DSM 13258]